METREPLSAADLLRTRRPGKPAWLRIPYFSSNVSEPLKANHFVTPAVINHLGKRLPVYDERKSLYKSNSGGESLSSSILSELKTAGVANWGLGRYCEDKFLTDMSSNVSSLSFPVDKRGTMKSVVEYFNQTYGFTIQHTQWPCLQVGNQ